MSTEAFQDLLKEFRNLSQELKKERSRTRLMMDEQFANFEKILDEGFRRIQMNEARAHRNMPNWIDDLRCQNFCSSKKFHHEDAEVKD